MQNLRIAPQNAGVLLPHPFTFLSLLGGPNASNFVLETRLVVSREYTGSILKILFFCSDFHVNLGQFWPKIEYFVIFLFSCGTNLEEPENLRSSK